MLNGTTSPGRGDGDEQTAAQRWVHENLDQLPQDYDAVIAHPVSYRQAIYVHLSPEVRSQLWSEQLRRHAAGNTGLTEVQRQVVDTAAAAAADPATFAAGAGSAPDRDLRQQAEQAFGHDQAARLFAVLEADIPASEISPAGRRGCTCATSDDWCDNTTHCNDSNQCDDTDGGWGWVGNTSGNGLGGN